MSREDGESIDEEQLDSVAEPINEHWAEQMGEDARPYVEPIWHGSILPALKVNALAENWTAEQFRERCIRALRATVDLFYALHINAGSNYTKENEKPRYYWAHQKFNILSANDATRGMSIQKDEMLRVAAEYLSHPEIRTNKFDWLLLDAIVFAELDAFSYHVSGFAATFANGNPAKYFALSALFKVIGFALGYLLLPAIAYFAFSRGQETTGWSIAGLWVVSVVWSLIGLPFRWGARRKKKELLNQMLDLYRVLGDSTISPRLLKGALDKAAAEGVVLDGAVFSIVDRIITRDATAFVPSRIG
ncbi:MULTISPECIES: hypothetical protein [Paraburkholderia]|uniref:Uncharacterized protein n=1 Tax=Paraburkholderia madseniana TaxID=2599607 RepID=A0AAP5F1Y0_9BURK|nr:MULTISPECIES: hypothetical protein [Paraburkholderia]MCX4152001.1 hypothetical protein [Paraburkholderia madseniana]MCX4176913.1 hypothetical protein [Paraburkholderia madseniana]MDN7154929.1 hypothetical protein [Paraburkholderia sp. WS6]MDQ6413812.1 hypothetical protein [Paraburkholderia madseniana]MDQ6464904.1 hypothetical protein [Paraburkholderia madseniana]